MVRRSVAVALGIVCIILAAGLGIAIFMSYSITTSSSVTNLQNQLNQLQDTYDSYVASHNHNDSEYNSLQSTYYDYVIIHGWTDSEYNALQDQVSDLTSTLSLGKSTVWVNNQTISQPASSYTTWNFSASYAGYVSIWIQSSNVSGTHVKAIYSAYGVNLNQEIVVSAGNPATFPILPASNIQIEVGNDNLVNGATETVTITYYY